MKTISTIFFLLQATNSEVLLANLGTLITAGLALIALVVWLVRLEAATKDLRKDCDEMDHTVNQHVKDNGAHVNQLHIGNLERRIGLLENSVHEIGKEVIAGNSRLSDKIDTKFEQLADKMR